MPRLRKDTKLHLLSGTQPQYAEQEPSGFRGGKLKKPEGLSPVADAEWDRMAKHLKRRGTGTPMDASSMEVYCETFAAWKAAGDELAAHGYYIEEEFLDRDGGIHTRRVENPALKTRIQMGNSLRAFQKEFAATPASREKAKRVAAEPKKELPREKTPAEIAAEEQRKAEADFLAKTESRRKKGATS